MKMGRFAETIIISGIGASLFTWWEVPLSFVLGPMVCVTLWRLATKREGHLPVSLRQFALLVFGVMLGTSFNLSTGRGMLHSLPLMLAATVLIILFSLLVGVWFAKRAGANTITGVFGSIPGGLTQMVLLSESVKGVDVTVVTFMQTFRLLGVIFVVPFLAVHGLGSGAETATPLPAAAVSAPVPAPWHAYLIFAGVAWLSAVIGGKLRLPSPYMLGPLFSTAALVMLGVSAPPLPDLLLLAAQIFIGAYIGLMMDPNSMTNLRQLGLCTGLSTFLLVLFSLGVGVLLTWFSPLSAVTGFLSTAPGGMAEMGVTARVVGADLSMVTGYHLFRIFFIMFAIPPLLMWSFRKQRQDA